MNNGSSQLKVHLFDKEERIIEHLEEFPPTIVVSNDDGIYIFANEIAKVHSSIVLAGAGDSFEDIADWFRGEIDKLIINWASNVPKIAIEGRKLLRKIFQNNIQFSKFITYADIVGIEIKENKEADKVFRMNAFGKWTDLSENRVNYISYKTLAKKSTDKKDKSAYTEKEIKKSVDEEKKRYDINELNILENKQEMEKLIVKYDYMKSFLNREKYLKKEFNWIYEGL